MRPPQIRLYDDEVIVDLFAGGGGASTGIEFATGLSPVLAINHNAEALAMHKANHPDTIHLREDVMDVNPRRRPELKGKKIGLAWFSPDCTFHSKARGGKPFRDRNRARKIRGLIGVVLKWASLPKAQRPRIICVENVEEIEFWGPLDRHGRPDQTRKGQSFRRWVSRLRNLGYEVEWRQLVTCDYGDPTKRKRLFIVARCDGQPIGWPVPTHGPGRALPYRTAAEHLDFSIPVPSIFMSRKEVKAWKDKYGHNPKRPLAPATLRRIARGIQRFVLDAADPFIIPVTHPRDERVHSIHDPLRTITASKRGEYALVTPFIAKHFGGRVGSRADEPLHTVMANGAHHALVTPFLSKFHGDKRETDARGQQLDLPINTLDTSNRFALIAPTLINTRNGERKGQAPRVHDIRQPFNTITAKGSQGALVAAFLAKHNAGHEATGQKLQRPVDTLTTKDSKAIVTSHLIKLRGGHQDHVHTDMDVREPLSTLTAGGNHIAEVRAFLVKFFGSKKDGITLDRPIDTVTTKPRFGLVTVTIADEEYVLADIGMRMLTPRELFACQGFPETYQIDEGVCVKTGAPVKFTKEAQTRLVGNSVPPNTAAAIIAANLATQEQPEERTA